MNRDCCIVRNNGIRYKNTIPWYIPKDFPI